MIGFIELRRECRRRVKTCEFHFKQCRNRQARKFDKETRKKFKKLSEALLEAQNPTSYKKAKENLDNFIAEEPERMRLTTWLEWWSNKRRSFIFPAFQCTKGGSKMNLAKMNMSLLDAAYADARNNVQLEVEFAAFREGNSSGETGPSVNDLRKRPSQTSSEEGRALVKISYVKTYKITILFQHKVHHQNNLAHHTIAIMRV